MSALHIDLDGAWRQDAVGDADFFNARDWGPKLRFTAPARVIESFYETIAPRLAAFTLTGSGDFHHLTALWLRRVREPFTLVAFDNHPDWDVRPPRWACGGWMNRALDLPQVQRAAVWGCGKLELNRPHRWFANRAALRSGRLEVHAWHERLPAKNGSYNLSITRENWREKFGAFAAALAGQRIYVTVDMDCLMSAEAFTNWEQGLFSADDIAWAVAELRAHASIVGGDVCGAWSRPVYARWRQKIAARFDHPRIPEPDEQKAREQNMRTLKTIWPTLTGKG